MVERGGLENRCAGNRTEGSNPSLSATDRQLKKRFYRLIWLPRFGSFRQISLPSKAISWLHNPWLRHRGLVTTCPRPATGAFKTFAEPHFGYDSLLCEPVIDYWIIIAPANHIRRARGARA